MELDHEQAKKENMQHMEQRDGCLDGIIKLYPRGTDEKFLEVSAYYASISKVLHGKCMEHYKNNKEAKDSFDILLPLKPR